VGQMARVVAPGMPHHVIQRGNRRQPTFFRHEDYGVYVDLMAQWCRKLHVEIWAYCLMQNHVHLVAVPDSEDGLAKAVGEAHRRYTRHVNFREGWRGHLWQGRFKSYPMDESYLLSAVRYIELNPVRAKLVREPAAYPWSSAAAHVEGREDRLVVASPLPQMVGDWREFLSIGIGADDAEILRLHERTGRPLGSPDFITRLESELARVLHRRKPGPKGTSKGN
jgi:putative transposase